LPAAADDVTQMQHRLKTFVGWARGIWSSWLGTIEKPLAVLEHVTLFCSRLHRGVIGSFARAIFSQDTPIMEIGQWLEPHGLLHQKLPGGHMATAFC